MAARRYKPSIDPWLDTDLIDERAPRTNQAIVALVTGLAYLLSFEPLVALMALQLVAGLALGRPWCVACHLYFRVIQPRLGEGRIEDSRPPRFANIVGAIFLTAATLLFAVGWTTPAWVLTLVVTALAEFAVVSGICVGCEMYVAFARVRGVALATR